VIILVLSITVTAIAIVNLVFAVLNFRSARRNHLNAVANLNAAKRNARIASGLASGNMNEVRKALDEALRLN